MNNFGLNVSFHVLSVNSFSDLSHRDFLWLITNYSGTPFDLFMFCRYSLMERVSLTPG